MNTKVVQPAAGRRKPPAAGKGRKKGSLNKVTRDVRDMVLAALNESGGVAYLVEQARENPQSFLALVGKIIPKEIKVHDDQQSAIATLLTFIASRDPRVAVVAGLEARMQGDIVDVAPQPGTLLPKGWG